MHSTLVVVGLQPDMLRRRGSNWPQCQPTQLATSWSSKRTALLHCMLGVHIAIHIATRPVTQSSTTDSAVFIRLHARQLDIGFLGISIILSLLLSSLFICKCIMF